MPSLFPSPKRFLVTTSVFLVLATFAALAQDDKLAAVHELLKRSGTRKTVMELPLIMKSGLDLEHAKATDSEKIAEKDLAALKRIIDQSFPTQKLYDHIASSVVEKISPMEIQSILKWTESELGKKDCRVSNESMTVERIQEMQQFVLDFPKHPLPEHRVKIVTEFIKATKSTDFQLGLMVKMAIGMEKGLNERLPPGEKKDVSYFQNREGKLFQELRKNGEEQGFASVAFLCRSYSDGELEELSRFYETPVMRKYLQVIETCMLDAFEKISKSFGRKVFETLKK